MHKVYTVCGRSKGIVRESSEVAGGIDIFIVDMEGRGGREDQGMGIYILHILHNRYFDAFIQKTDKPYHSNSKDTVTVFFSLLLLP